MTINPLLSTISSALAQQSAPAPIRQTSTPTDASTPATVTANDTSPSQSVVQNANLQSASSSFAQLSSLLEIAQSGTEDINTILTQLQSLAQPAAAGDSSDATSESEFQQLLTQIDETVQKTTFGGTPLLDGSQSGNNAGQQNSLSLPDLSTQGLFGGTLPDISTPEGANNALAALSQAQQTVGTTNDAIDETFTQLNFAAASVDSALANGTAATSTLNEGDLNNESPVDIFSSLLSQPGQATQAQTGNLSNLLSLLQE